MTKKTAHHFTEPSNVDTKPYRMPFNGKESSAMTILVPNLNRKLGTNKAGQFSEKSCYSPCRINATASSSDCHQIERKQALITRSDTIVNSRLLDSRQNSTAATQYNQGGIVSQASVRIRKRKSCVTLPRCRRPGILLGVGTTSKNEARTGESGLAPGLIPINPFKKRVEFHSQTRLDKLNLSTMTMSTSQTAREATDLSQSTPDEKDSNRYHVFSYEQVKRLDDLLQTQLCISPRPTFWDYGLMPTTCPELTQCYPGLNPSHPSPTQHPCLSIHSTMLPKINICDACTADNDKLNLMTRVHKKDPVLTRSEQNNHVDPNLRMPIISVQLKQLIRTIRDRLIEEQITVREIRLNGGAAGSVISLEEQETYSDLDVIFNVDLSNSITFTKIKSIVFSSVAQFLADTFACGNLVYSCTQNPSVCTTTTTITATTSSSGNTNTTSASNSTSNTVTTGSTPTPIFTTTSGRQQSKRTEAIGEGTNEPDDLSTLNASSELERPIVINKVNCNQTRTRSSHSFTSATDMNKFPSSSSSPSSYPDASYFNHNRRASENSILVTGTPEGYIKPITCASSNNTTSSTAAVLGANSMANTMSNNANTTMAMMMALTSCFFSTPFHSFPCSQNWTRLLRDESLVKQYIQKMVRIHKPSSKTADSWSLFTLGYRTPDGGKSVDVKFVDRMQRPFEFTVDSFQIVLDSLMTFYETSRQAMDEHFYPTVVAESVAGSFTEALSHLKDRLIATPRPEEIRGGGLLKYCKLLVDGYRPSSHTDVLSMERYMCSRFFIDFPDIVSQHQRLTYYLTNHFDNSDATKATYLQILHEVVSHSTVCLMTHERQQTLCLIRMLLQDVLSRSEVNKTGVHLEEFSTENWALDSIYYGTTYFPKQLYLLSEPIQTMSAVDDMSASSLLYPDSHSSQIANEPVVARSFYDDSTQADTVSDTNVKLPIKSKEGQSTDSDPSGPGRESVVTSQPELCNAMNSSNRLVEKGEWEAPGELTVTNTEMPATQKNDGLERLKTDTPKDQLTTTSLSPVADDLAKVESSVYDGQDDLTVKHPTDGELHSLGEGCFTDMHPGPYINSPMYYIPQVVTYFPTPMKYPKEMDEANSSPDNTDGFFCSDIDTSKSMPHYHAGIILPQIESTGASEMNHYVGVPCSDMQYAYSNYPCGIIDSTDCGSYPSSMYCYSPDPGYLVYANPILQNSPTLILAYPM